MKRIVTGPSLQPTVCMLVAQLCLTLWNPMDCRPPGSSVHGILQATTLEWVAMPFSRDLPNPGIEFRSPALQVDSLLSELPGKAKIQFSSVQSLSRVRLFATP